jgi:hypothetical protein
MAFEAVVLNASVLVTVPQAVAGVVFPQGREQDEVKRRASKHRRKGVFLSGAIVR